MKSVSILNATKRPVQTLVVSLLATFLYSTTFIMKIEDFVAITKYFQFKDVQIFYYKYLKTKIPVSRKHTTTFCLFSFIRIFFRYFIHLLF